MSVIYRDAAFLHGSPMVTHDEIMAELIRRLDEKSVTGKEIAELLGIPPARVTEMRRGTRKIQQNEMPILANHFGMVNDFNPAMKLNVDWIPVIGLASAGKWEEAIDLPMFMVPQLKKPNTRQAFAVLVDGDSMDQILPERSYAVIDPDKKQLMDKRVYLIQNGSHEATIKRYRSEPARFEPVSNNPIHEPIMVGEHPITIIGQVVSFTSDQGL